jgi:acyl dehydratase
MMTDELDTSDLDRYVGVPLAEQRLVEPIHVNDIRRWVQAMRHPNPLFYDREYAAASRFGQIVAPQSFAIVTNANQGFGPASTGTIPNSHQLFGGDDWWFYGPRITPGDTTTITQMTQGYRVTDTAFAGPTVFQRGDSHYSNQRGEPVALQRSTAIRYMASAAREKASLLDLDAPNFTDEELAGFFKERETYVATITALGHDARSWNSVNVGDELPTKVVGPHSPITFATEWRAYLLGLWGNVIETKEYLGESDLGITAEMSRFTENGAWDPEFADQAYYGASKGHLSDEFARWIGMPRSYGYGASMGAWIVDYLSSWAGEWGFVTHTSAQYRGPALSGDVTYLRGQVIEKSESLERGQGTIAVEYVMTSHRGEVMAKGRGEMSLPLE